MNIILLTSEQIENSSTSTLKSSSSTVLRVQLSARQAKHCIDILKVKTGDVLTIGIIDQLCGKGRVEQITDSEVWLSVDVDAVNQYPPPAANITLYLALPRPKMLRRMLRTVAEIGIKRLHIINTSKVEKSYWQSPALRHENINQYFLEGLEQAKDTVVPEYQVHKLFKPFVEDQLSMLVGAQPNQAWVAHSGHAEASLATVRSQHALQPDLALHLFVGPEGGFNQFEIDLLAQSGVQSFNAGQRIFRTETFLPWILGTLQKD